MSNEIDEVYILNKYKQGTYILKDIPFNTIRKNSDDICIKFEFNHLCAYDKHIEQYDYEFWSVDKYTEDISKILKVTYDNNDILKSVEVLSDIGIWYPYIYNYTSKEEIENHIQRYVDDFLEYSIQGIKQIYNGEPIRRLFISIFPDRGHFSVNLTVGNETAFNQVLQQYNEEYGSNIVDHAGNYNVKCDIIPFTYSICLLNCLTQNFNEDLLDYKTTLTDMFNRLKEGIITEVEKFATLTNDFKFIIDEYD